MTNHKTEFAPEGAAIYDTLELREAVQMALLLLDIMRSAHAAIQDGNEDVAEELLGKALNLWDAELARVREDA